MYKIILVLIVFIVFCALFRKNVVENAYFHIPTRDCSGTRFTSPIDERGTVNVQLSNHPMLIGQSEAIGYNKRFCTDDFLALRESKLAAE